MKSFRVFLSLLLCLAWLYQPAAAFAEPVGQAVTVSDDEIAADPVDETASNPTADPTQDPIADLPTDASNNTIEGAATVESSTEPAAELEPLAATPEQIAWYTANTAATTFTVNTRDELFGLAKLVNNTAGYAGGAVNFSGKTILLKASTAFNLNGFEWEPIGTPTNAFNGTFDGQSTTGTLIQGLTITQTLQNSGLFGYAGEQALLRSVKISNPGGALSTSLTLTPSSGLVRAVGLLAGTCLGSIDNCDVNGSLKVKTTTVATFQNPYVVQNVGGVVGFCKGNLSNTAFHGSFEIGITTDAKDPRDDLTQTPILPEGNHREFYKVGDSFGGVAGRVGTPGAGNHGSVTNCRNDSNVWVYMTGAGAQDRFGVDTYARTYYVGGVVGYSNGSVVNCVNGIYNQATHTGSGLVSTSNNESVSGADLSNRGSDTVGGVVGGVAMTQDTQYASGQLSRNASDPLAVVDCRNYGRVVGLSNVGGIAGCTAAFTTVTQNFNGLPNGSTQDEEACAKVTTTRWNKPTSGGIIGRAVGSIVSYSANYANVYNIQSGYYTAGVAGSLEPGAGSSGQQAELYACYNVGHVRTAGSTQSQDYREAGLIGINDAFAHDSLTMEGSVPYHSDSVIGETDFKLYENLETWTSAKLKTASAAAFLNANAQKTGLELRAACPFPAELSAYAVGNWQVYWYVDSPGNNYPSLRSSANASAVDTAATQLISFDSATVLKDAEYISVSAAPTPVISVVVNGLTLVQGADFKTVVDPGSTAIDGIYQAGIEGIGRYKGSLANVVAYTILKCDLTKAAVNAVGGKYDFGNLVPPLNVDVLIEGQPIDASEFSYRIYSLNTTVSYRNKNTTSYDPDVQGQLVYDSNGYWSTDDGQTFKSILTYPLPDVSTPFIIYDRNKNPISNNAGQVLRPVNGIAIAGDYGCSVYLGGSNGAPAGLLMKIEAAPGSPSYTGQTWGQYVVRPVDLNTDADITAITWAGANWKRELWSPGLYDVATNDIAVATFTGDTIKPTATVTYNGHTLVADKEFEYYYSDPAPSDAAGYLANRDATVDSSGAAATTLRGRAAVTVQPYSKTQLSNFANYVNMYFEIAPARLDDCQISLAETSYDYTGRPQTPKPEVSLSGVKLIEDRDYSLTYSNNTIGQAKVTVTALTNLSAGVASRDLSFTVTTPAAKTIESIEGDSRYTTAAKIVQRAYPFGSDGVIICYGDDYPDSLAASSLAGLLDYPIVMTPTDALHDATQSELLRLSVGKAAGAFEVLVVGGTGVVKDTVITQIQNLSPAMKARRVFGNSRYLTQMEIYKEGKTNPRAIANGGWGDTVVLATGKGFADALSIAPFAVAKNAPIFLVDQSLIGGAEAVLQADYGNGRTTKQVVIVGGDGVVTNDVSNRVSALVRPSSGRVERLGGEERYETSQKIASYLVTNLPADFGYHNVAFATGENYADALAGGVLQAKHGGVMILVNNTSKGLAGVDLIAANKPTLYNIRYLGGTTAVPTNLRQTIQQRIGF